MADGNQLKDDESEEPEAEITADRPAGMPLEEDLPEPVVEAPDDAPDLEATQSTDPIEQVDAFALRVAAHPEYDRADFPDVRDDEITEALGYLDKAVKQAREDRENAREERSKAMTRERRQRAEKARERAGWVAEDDGGDPLEE